jgi:hypothetical protein
LPILHKANCARLALDVLLVTAGSQSPRHAIERLESQFPAPFMDGIVKSSQPKPIGASTAEKQTFELALEIRTQYFVMELERRQNEKDFDPQSILRGVFYDELALEDQGSKVDPGSLRGFKLAQTFEDENGRLPDRFQDDVIDRIGELELDLLDQDGSPQIRDLKRTSWTRFIQRIARFIFTRDKEIKFDLQQQPNIDEVDDLVRKEIERRDTGARETPDPRQTVVPASVERSVHEPPREPSIIASAERTRESLAEANLPGPQVSSQTSVGLPSPAGRPTKSPSKHSERRKSTKTYVFHWAVFMALLTSHPRSRFLAQSIDEVVKRREAARRNQDLSHLESQHTSRLSATSEHPSFHMPASRTRDEVPQSPQPESSQPRYPRAESIASADYDLNLRHNDESLNINMETEAEVTASPVMRRTNLKSLLFDRSSGVQDQSSPPQSTADRWNAVYRSPTQQAQQAQPRSFIDRQANATRVSWGESIDDSPQSARRRREGLAAPTSTSTLKRPRIDSDDESDSEDPFVTDERNIDAAGRRAQKPHQTHPDKRMRRNSSNQSAADQVQQSLDASTQVQPPASTQLASTQRSSQSAAVPPSTQSRYIERITDETAGPTVKHKRFSSEENERLIELVGLFSTKWADIKRHDELWPEDEGGPLLLGRSQINLKDRARNIRRAYDRRGEPLPKNFEHVTP